jgi:sigma-B regulation protein RsbU (phosphoserine phosphatase)
MSGHVGFFDSATGDWRRSLQVTVEVMRELSLHTDPLAMQRIYTRRMTELFPISRHLTISRRGLERPAVRVTRFSLWPEEINPLKEPERLPIINGGLFGDLIYGDEPRIIDDLELAPDDPAYEYVGGQRSLLAIPHYDGGVALNMVIATREEPNAFPKERFPELVWMSNLFGRATQASLLSEKLKAAVQASDHEMQAVARLQRGLLPSSLPKIPTLDLAVHYQPSGRSGGDYYDLFPLPKGRWGILIADVSGHGTPAAVLMAITHTLARTYSGPPQPPGLLLEYINRQLAEHYTKPFGAFVTAFHAIYDPNRGTLTCANAGHVPPRLIRADGSRGPLDAPQRLPLGIAERAEYPEKVLSLVPGDQVVFFTDGVTEAANADGEHFGPERLDAALAAGHAGARGMVDAVLREVASFTDNSPPSDDRTLLAAKFVTSSSPTEHRPGERRPRSAEPLTPR